MDEISVDVVIQVLLAFLAYLASYSGSRMLNLTCGNSNQEFSVELNSMHSRFNLSRSSTIHQAAASATSLNWL